jgi:uncharacterized protein (TIGR02001 family)
MAASTVITASHLSPKRHCMFIDLPPPDPQLEISVASNGYSKGLRQTNGAQLVVRAEVAFGDVSFGGLWKNITNSTADGEAQLYVGYDREVAGVDLSLTAGFHFLTSVDTPTDNQRFEANVTISKRIGAVVPRLSVTYSPDDFGGTGQSLYVEGGLGYRLSSGTTISANIGRRERSNNTNYTTFNVGVVQQIVRNVTAEVRYYDTAESALGETYEGRVAALVRVRF